MTTTSQASNPDGSQDPDDGQGHGTHVAGIALGTENSSRVHIGAAPGSFLVDVKVLTDSGGTNSQNSLNGIQWMINNVDTDWGNGAKEFKSVRCRLVQLETPINQDNGDNGTGAEARLVNNATYDAGIACIVAAGNDGRQRIASPEAQMEQSQSVQLIMQTQSIALMISWLLTPTLVQELVIMMMMTGTS